MFPRGAPIIWRPGQLMQQTWVKKPSKQSYVCDNPIPFQNFFKLEISKWPKPMQCEFCLYSWDSLKPNLGPHLSPASIDNP